ncbi:hypothetical protein RCL_jg19844.t1 [Rhizophagus clarus]|uniref:Uncharacterized protein n=1 Tax=Rhizophagus clarus TaxID=94130 RepID=A0A8H3QJR3_9GLOM|nr:hypothetical protein RCL_jg19844.t1 [Rhizophagus clarus]
MNTNNCSKLRLKLKKTIYEIEHLYLLNIIDYKIIFHILLFEYNLLEASQILNPHQELNVNSKEGYVQDYDKRRNLKSSKVWQDEKHYSTPFEQVAQEPIIGNNEKVRYVKELIAQFNC